MANFNTPFNSNYYGYGGYPQEGPPRSITDPSWTYPPVNQLNQFGPQGPPPHMQGPPAQMPGPPAQMQGPPIQLSGPPQQVSGPGPVRPQFNPPYQAPFKSANVRIPRQKGPLIENKVAHSWPMSNADWLSKLDRDTPTTILDFQPVCENGGVPFSDRLLARVDNLKFVAGEVLMSIYKAATVSSINKTETGIDGIVEKPKEVSLADQIRELEKLEKRERKHSV